MKDSNKHLEEVEESYWQHATFAFKGSAELFRLSLLSLIHGLIPGIYRFETPEGILRITKIIRKKHPDLYRKYLGQSSDGPKGQ